MEADWCITYSSDQCSTQSASNLQYVKDSGLSALSRWGDPAESCGNVKPPTPEWECSTKGKVLIYVENQLQRRGTIDKVLKVNSLQKKK
jgi:hypothetical protein